MTATRILDRSRPESLEVTALTAAIFAGAAGLVLALLVFSGGKVSLAGEGSLGATISQLAAMTGSAAFAWSFYRHSRSSISDLNRHRWRRVADMVGLSLTGGVMMSLLTGSVFALFQLAFRDLTLDPFAAIILTSATLAITSYVLVAVAAQITTSSLATLLALFLVAGVFSSMLTADDPRWWESNFSALGMGGALSAQTFNLTVILAGAIVTILADYLTIDLRSRQTAAGGDLHGVSIVRSLLILVGVALIGIGVVPVDRSLLFHNIFAISALVGFAALIVLVPLVLQGLPRTFTAVTAGFIIVIVGAVLMFWPIGYYTLTAVELVSVLTIFVWLILFVRSTGSASARDLVAVPAAETLLLQQAAGQEMSSAESGVVPTGADEVPVSKTVTDTKGGLDNLRMIVSGVGLVAAGLGYAAGRLTTTARRR